MNFSTALLLFILSARRGASAQQQSRFEAMANAAANIAANNSAANTQDRGLDILLDYDDGNDSSTSSTTLTEGEYEELVNWRTLVTSYWTPDALASAKPLHGLVTDTDIPTINIEDATNFLDETIENARQFEPTYEYEYEDNGRKLLRHNQPPKQQRNLQQLVSDSAWTSGGDVHHAAGRLVFVKNGENFLCSATAIRDGSTMNGRSIIVTAAHCVYDDATKKVSSMFVRC